MLVLTRKQGEQIVASVGGHTIRIRMVGVRGKKVRLGITAPSEVVVHREEIWNKMLEWQPGTKCLSSETSRETA